MSTQPIKDHVDLNPARKGVRRDADGNVQQNTGLGTTFKKDDYSISSMTYPTDLYDNQAVYGGNYVVFYINVADDSKLISSGAVKAIKGDIPPRLRGTLIGQDLNKLEATAAGATAGAFTGTSLSALQGGDIAGATKNIVGGAVIGGVQGGVVAANSNGTARQQKRITDAIALHIPNQLNINYSMDWQSEDTFMFQAAAMANREVGKAVATMGAKSNLMGTAGGIANNIALNNGPIAGALSASSGMAANPMKEQVFKNVNFRKFTFDYTFSPRDPGEAKAIKQIIRTFKLHMHPEYKDKNNFVFIYPSEFDVYYYQGGTENLNLHRHPSCVLTDMNINYTPNGQFTTFEGGMPTQINVTLSFLELAILTKDQIQDNF